MSQKMSLTRMVDDFSGLAGQLPRRLDLVYHLETDSFRGTFGLQMRLLDLAPAAS